jgi:aminopeptidase Y
MKLNNFIRALVVLATGARAHKQLTPQRVADDIKAEE